MALELKKDAAYALLVPTSMGVRLTPTDGQPFHCSTEFKMQVTSAETNVEIGRASCRERVFLTV